MVVSAMRAPHAPVADPHFLVKFVGGWCLTWFAVVLIRQMSPKIRRILDNHGVTLAFFAVAAQTPKGTDTIYRWGTSHRRFLRAWFTLGILCTIGGFVISSSFLTYNLYRESRLLLDAYPITSLPSLLGLRPSTTSQFSSPPPSHLPLPPTTLSTSPPEAPPPPPSNELIPNQLPASKTLPASALLPQVPPSLPGALETEPSANTLPDPPPPPLPHESILTIAIPGLTVPWHQFGYLIVAIVISVSFHELGHALAAAAYRVRTESIGMFWMLFFPGAFVELDEKDGLHRLQPIQRMKITTAGIWHNTLLCLFALAILLSLNFLLWPFYSTSSGVGVIWVFNDEDMAHALPSGSIITQLNGDTVSGVDDWKKYLMVETGDDDPYSPQKGKRTSGRGHRDDDDGNEGLGKVNNNVTGPTLDRYYRKSNGASTTSPTGTETTNQAERTKERTPSLWNNRALRIEYLRFLLQQVHLPGYTSLNTTIGRPPSIPSSPSSPSSSPLSSMATIISNVRLEPTGRCVLRSHLLTRLTDITDNASCCTFTSTPPSLTQPLSPSSSSSSPPHHPRSLNASTNIGTCFWFADHHRVSLSSSSTSSSSSSTLSHASSTSDAHLMQCSVPSLVRNSRLYRSIVPPSSSSSPTSSSSSPLSSPVSPFSPLIVDPSAPHCHYACLTQVKTWIDATAPLCARNDDCQRKKGKTVTDKDRGSDKSEGDTSDDDYVCMHPILSEDMNAVDTRLISIIFNPPYFPSTGEVITPTTNTLSRPVRFKPSYYGSTAHKRSSSSSSSSSSLMNGGINLDADQVDPTISIADEPRFLLFLGHPHELLINLYTTEFLPRGFLRYLLTFVSYFLPSTINLILLYGWWFTVLWPGVLLRLLKYVISVSASLAMLNSAPIHFADGALTLEQLGRLILKHKWRTYQVPSYPSPSSRQLASSSSPPSPAFPSLENGKHSSPPLSSSTHPCQLCGQQALSSSRQPLSSSTSPSPFTSTKPSSPFSGHSTDVSLSHLTSPHIPGTADRLSRRRRVSRQGNDDIQELAVYGANHAVVQGVSEGGHSCNPLDDNRMPTSANYDVYTHEDVEEEGNSSNNEGMTDTLLSRNLHTPYMVTPSNITGVSPPGTTNTLASQKSEGVGLAQRVLTNLGKKIMPRVRRIGALKSIPQGINSLIIKSFVEHSPSVSPSTPSTLALTSLRRGSYDNCPCPSTTSSAGVDSIPPLESSTSTHSPTQTAASSSSHSSSSLDHSFTPFPPPVSSLWTAQSLWRATAPIMPPLYTSDPASTLSSSTSSHPSSASTLPYPTSSSSSSASSSSSTTSRTTSLFSPTVNSASLFTPSSSSDTNTIYCAGASLDRFDMYNVARGNTHTSPTLPPHSSQHDMSEPSSNTITINHLGQRSKTEQDQTEAQGEMSSNDRRMGQGYPMTRIVNINHQQTNPRHHSTYHSISSLHNNPQIGASILSVLAPSSEESASSHALGTRNLLLSPPHVTHDDRLVNHGNSRHPSHSNSYERSHEEMAPVPQQNTMDTNLTTTRVPHTQYHPHHHPYHPSHHHHHHGVHAPLHHPQSHSQTHILGTSPYEVPLPPEWQKKIWLLLTGGTILLAVNIMLTLRKSLAELAGSY